MSGQVSALNDAIENAGYWNNSILGKTVYLGGQTFYVDAKGNILTQQDQVKIQWNNLTDTQKQTVAGLYSQDLYRTNPFAETTKQIAVAGQKGGIIGELATSPLTGITIPIAKAASGQHVTAQDVEGAVCDCCRGCFDGRRRGCSCKWIRERRKGNSQFSCNRYGNPGDG